MIKIATHEGSIHEKTKTPERVPKLAMPGIVSKALYISLSFLFFISEAFEMSR